LAAAAGSGAEEKDPLDAPLIQAPGEVREWPEWRRKLQAWREEKRRKFGYDDRLYRREDLAWTASSYSCCFAMLCDEALYSPRERRWRLAEFLDEGVREFGGYDSIVWWHAYPRIGLDDRNQFDFYRDQPGGLRGLRDLARQCHARGVRTYIDYNPWDRRTRREPLEDLDALAALVRDVEADGIFLDTMDKGAGDFRSKLDAARPGVALEGEIALPLENLHDHHLSWAQWFQDSEAPGILRNKWFERRHTLHQIHRWNRDHSAELQTAWMNGTGMMVWENVFGSWVGWNARDRSMYRAMLPVQRRYARVFTGEGWTPLTHAPGEGVYASLWEGEGVKLRTLVNRKDATYEGALAEGAKDERHFDLITGRELRAESGELRGRIAARGVGCVLSAKESALGKGFGEFLKGQARLAARASQSVEFPARTARLRAVERTKAMKNAPAGMVRVPAASWRMEWTMRIRECGFYVSSDPHFAGTGFHPLHEPKRFVRDVTHEAYWIDESPVTNAEYADFLRQSGYKPADAHNFLRHWAGGAPPAGQGDHPVVWVDLEDARAYAKWAGKRLPAEAEWQYAGQGGDGRSWPWGREFDAALCNHGQTGGTTEVRRFAAGRSPFGCYDLSGNVWEWTESEHSDGRTRFAMIRGGSWWKVEKGSDWYMDMGAKPVDFAAKVLLQWPGMDRNATVGFRCAADGQ
jgi:formylglycine-generating enzyme required for sulfatase activity